MSELFILFPMSNWENDNFVANILGKDEDVAKMLIGLTNEAMEKSFVGQLISQEGISWAHIDFPNTIRAYNLTDSQKVAITLATTTETLFEEDPTPVSNTAPVGLAQFAK